MTRSITENGDNDGEGEVAGVENVILSSAKLPDGRGNGHATGKIVSTRDRAPR